MEPEWWTIVVRAWPQKETESGLVIRLIRSCPDGDQTRTLVSVSSAAAQIVSWLTELAELDPNDPQGPDRPD